MTIKLFDKQSVAPDRPTLQAYVSLLRSPQSLSDLDTSEQQQPPCWRFQILQRFPITARGAPQALRMGALDLSFPGFTSGTSSFSVPTEAQFTQAQATELFAAIDLKSTLPDGSWCTRREFSFALVAQQVGPGGQDDVPGQNSLADIGADVFDSEVYLANFRRTQPVVLDLTPAPTSTATPFDVVFREKTHRGADRVVQVTLRVVAQPGTSDSLVAYVFDPEPFLFARVTAAAWGASFSEALTNEIGHWSNQAGVDGWQLAASGPGFTLELPPQAIGESMHKRGGENDILPGKLVDFRFTPTATFQLQASFVAQRFAEAPWNLRRILGYPGQRAPGAAMDGAQFELLYGLATSISKPSARLAELGSLLGAPAGAQHASLSWSSTPLQRSVYETARLQWSSLQPALRSRLAVLQPWRDGDSFTPSFDDVNHGVVVTQRNTARLRYPIPGDIPAGFFTDGLAGGWSWGFESRNILTAILRNLSSTAAELHGLFFSSLGAWGHEKASFDEGRSTIYCDVSMGRVESITIERLGRIEPFWNRAKHVIVYRRTVAASRQFYLEQLPFQGNPILRKTDEYVKLIEAERPFPDANTAAANRGFVIGCRFEGKPPRIRVDSLWGGDVGVTGWQVPLWRADASPSDVYPRPDVGLLFAGQQAGEAIKYSVSNPDIARFYTDTQTGTGSNSDLWAAVEGVSFARFDPTPWDEDARTAFPASAVEDNAVCPGTSGFTFRLDPAPAPANVVVDRSSVTSISARIGNVTVMRGFVAGGDARDPQLIAFDTLSTTLANSFAGPVWTIALDAEAGKNSSHPPAAGPALAAAAVPTPLDNLKAGLDTLKSEVDKKGIHGTLLTFDVKTEPHLPRETLTGRLALRSVDCR